MKKLIKKIARNFGVDICRYRPSNSAQEQICRALKVASINVVFDIGANEGQFAREIREYGFTGKIISFEPLSSARKKLLKFAMCDVYWHVHNQSAIGDQDGEIELFISGNSVSSSVLPMLKSHSSAAFGSAYIDAERVPIAKIDTIAAQYLTPSTNLFVKIDTQGFEWQVLDGATETLKQAHGVLCELSLLPLYDGQRLWLDIVDRLDQQGFMVWAVQQGFTDPRTGQSLQMDGIFLRKSIVDSLK